MSSLCYLKYLVFTISLFCSVVSFAQDQNGNGILDALECPDVSRIPIVVNTNDTAPITDLLPDGSCSDPAGGNLGNGGTYQIINSASSELSGDWQNPSGNINLGTQLLDNVQLPQGNFFAFNAFVANGESFACVDISTDTNVNGNSGEINCFETTIEEGTYEVSAFFTAITGLDPASTIFDFQIVDTDDGTLIASKTLTNISQGNRDWQYNQITFAVNGTTNVRACILQTSNFGPGADIAIDNFGLYQVTCSDADGDGVVNFVDLDDDNDGILDTTECASSVTNSSFTFSQSVIPASQPIGSPSSGFTALTETSAGNILSFEAQADGEDILMPGRGTTSVLEFNINLAPGETILNTTLNLEIGTFDDGLYIAINGLAVVDFDFDDYRGVTAIRQRFGNNDDWAPWAGEGNPVLTISNGSVQLLVDDAIDGGRSNILDYMPGTSTNNLPIIDFENGIRIETAAQSALGIGSISLQNLNFSAEICAGDTDGDGILDILDLDSDNDGCPDFAEGSANLTLDNGVSTPSSLTDGNTGQVNTNLGITVDANGVPTIVAGGQDSVSNQDDQIRAYACCPQDFDGDGICDDVDLDDDNDGILDTVECQSASPCNLDTDNDGLINSLDTDADNDGCPDALEGNATFGLAQLTPDGRLAGAVDSNGVPVVANGGQGIGSALNNLVLSQVCEDLCLGPVNDQATTRETGLNETGLDANWQVEWVSVPEDNRFAPASDGVVQQAIVGRFTNSWLVPQAGTQWISYDFSNVPPGPPTNSPAVHRDVDMDGISSETNANTAPDNPTGDEVRLVFSTIIELPNGVLPGSVLGTLNLSVDNQISQIFVNGQPNIVEPANIEFIQLAGLNLPNGWQEGANTLEIVVESSGSLVGLYIQSFTVSYWQQFELSANEQILGCNDNGTSADASDDFFEITLDPQGLNLGTTYTVSVDGGLTINPTTANYGAATTFTITGLTNVATDYVVTIQDDNAAGCTVDVPINAASCSQDCSITEANEQILGCNDNGTSADASDDFFEITLDPQGLNLGTTYTVSVDGGLTINPTTANYGAATTFTITGLTNVATDYVVTIQDDNAAGCNVDVPINAASCSDECTITAANEILLGCDDNGTTEVQMDDTFSIILNPEGFNLGDEYSVQVNGGLTIAPNIGSYGEETRFTLSGLTQTALDYTITIVDSNDGNCNFTVVFNASACSIPCDLVVLNENVLGCANSGTPYVNEAEDDFIEFTLSPEGLNIGQVYNISYVGDGTVEPAVGRFGVTTLFRLYPGSADGVTNHRIQFATTMGVCATEVELGIVDSCSEQEFPRIGNDLIEKNSSDLSIFRIENIEDFPNNKVSIYNRWGRKVFEIRGYDNVSNYFEGRANTDFIVKESEDLPKGVYFYVLEFSDNLERTQTLNGYLYLK